MARRGKTRETTKIVATTEELDAYIEESETKLVGECCCLPLKSSSKILECELALVHVYEKP
jgi:hypothetical protein